jgi:uncharacterized protein YukE
VYFPIDRSTLCTLCRIPPRDPLPMSCQISPRAPLTSNQIMAVISGGVLYGLTSLARKYLLPHLRPPSSTAFQQTSSDLTAQYDEAARLLSELQTQTEALQAGLEGERERVRVAVEDVEEAVRGVREGEERWREEMREIRGEVESVRELVPRVSASAAQRSGAERSGASDVTAFAYRQVASRQVSGLARCAAWLEICRCPFSPSASWLAVLLAWTSPRCLFSRSSCLLVSLVASALAWPGPNPMVRTTANPLS